jgi:hypothetical protein
MFYPILRSEGVQLNQAYNFRRDIDDNDVPPERRQRSASLDDRPAWVLDDERDEHDEWNHLLDRLYTQGIRTTRVA